MPTSHNDKIILIDTDDCYVCNECASRHLMSGLTTIAVSHDDDSNPMCINCGASCWPDDDTAC
jgi:DNA-directed RNA polymerase subunit RPC12/RpoP